MKRNKNKKQKRRKIGLYIFLTVVLLIAFGTYIVLEVFTVENVVVEGNVWYKSEQIEKMLLNDEYSWNSLYVTLKYRFVDIGEVPFVDEMEVSLDNPHTLHIKVYEKAILGYLYIPVLGQNAYFDKDGFVVETSANTIPDVPKITGLSCNEVILYEKLPLKNEGVLRLLLNLTQTLKKYELVPNEIVFDTQEGAVVRYGDIRAIIGEEEYLAQKVIRLAEILSELSNRGLTCGTIHLENWTEESKDVVFDIEEKNENL